MYDDLVTRPTLREHFNIPRSTLAAYARYNLAFPPARGMKGRFSLYSLAEVTAFFAEHAPQYITRAEAE